uniref:Retrovirus-related Pol polyprotein from transposon TNT 1-94 n=1 Tax=Tanacetum cinerariifolium TaxID=118510 RepID=A0A6L2LVM3_TANCI|nr:retrovirus-related Pol polyprotein from transposon TNT 1-94 [Tanacetum cinerariifolium]
MTGAKFDIEKFNGTGDFGLWRIKMRALLIQHGCETPLKVLLVDMKAQTKDEIKSKAHSAVILCLGNKVLREVTGETTAVGVWSKLETLYMTKSLANKFYLKKKLYTFYMPAGQKKSEHIDEFNKIVLDLANIEVKFEDEDLALLLLTSLPVSYEHFVDTLLYGRKALTLEGGFMSVKGKVKIEVLSVLLDENKECKIRGISKVEVQLRDGSSFMLNNVRVIPLIERNLISLKTLENEGYTVKLQSGKVKVSLMLVLKKKTALCMFGTKDWDISVRRDYRKVTSSQFWCRKVHYSRGQSQVESSGGKRYFLSIVADYSRGVWVYLLRLDDESPKIVTSRNVVFNESVMYKDTLKDSGTCANKSIEELQVEVELQMDSQRKNKTWELVDRLAGKKLVSRKWMFKIKEEIEGVQKPRYKARLVACGFIQTVGVRHEGARGSKEDSCYGYHQGSESQDSKVVTIQLSLKDFPVRDCDVERMSKVSYANAVGSLMYLMVCTRPDIAYAVSVVSKYLANPDRGNHVDVTGFVDSDNAKDPDKGGSITSYTFLVQGCVDVKEAIWLKGLLEELCVELNTAAVNCDNQGAIHLSRNHVFHERTKHISVRYHFIREVLKTKTVKVMKMGTEHNVADVLTKVVPGLKLQHCLVLLNVSIG